jgi:anti-anti-sigma factor
MKFILEAKKDITIFRLQEKRLDATLAPELKSQIVLLIEAEGKKHLIIDLALVESIDSSGIGALLIAHRQTAVHDGFAAFIGVKGNVRDLLRMMQLDKQLYIFSSVQDVMRNLEAVEVEEENPKSKADDEEEEEPDLLADIPEIAVDGLVVGEISIDEENAEAPEFPDNVIEEDEESPKKSGKGQSSKKPVKPKSAKKAKTETSVKPKKKK